ncbi:MAG: SurA N-terminal domain-containing protein [Desulfobacterales bacterium]|nr:SurA N-terminal domain-containing protein [Desulfobacterales bacterium]
MAGTAIICMFSSAFGLFGCSYFGQNEDDIVLIRVGNRVTTVGDFKGTFEITKTAYPHNILQEGTAYKEAQLRLLNQLTEEMIVLERAEELGIKISNTELEKAVSKIKEDYPNDVFEELLLENAVSYESWKERLRIRLVIQKTIENEVESKIEITPDDISNYYKEKREKEKSLANMEGIESEKEEVIVNELRREKAEKEYQKWIKKFQKKYTIEINNEAWEKIKKL